MTMERADVVIVGAGLLGCFAARALSAYNLRILVLEQREDVCTGISKANTAIIYTGYDTRPGTLKTSMCTRANIGFDRLCEELDVRFRRCGSLLVSFGPRAEAVIQQKYEQGLRSGVPGLRLLDREEVLRREPHLSPEVTRGLYAPGPGPSTHGSCASRRLKTPGPTGRNFVFPRRLCTLYGRKPASCWRRNVNAIESGPCSTARGCFPIRCGSW